MTLVFDTSALSPLLRNDDNIVRALSRYDFSDLLIPLATDAEIRFGFANGNRQAKNLSNYELFKRQFNLRLIKPDQDTAIIYAELAAWARQNGLALSNNDIWIAATCVQAGGILAAADGDFGGLPQVRLLKFD
jgi:tRNA(fMet)-specific endonuclease VapC